MIRRLILSLMALTVALLLFAGQSYGDDDTTPRWLLTELWNITSAGTSPTGVTVETKLTLPLIVSVSDITPISGSALNWSNPAGWNDVTVYFWWAKKTVNYVADPSGALSDVTEPVKNNKTYSP